MTHRHWMIENADELRTLAQQRRNTGLHTGKRAKGWDFTRPPPDYAPNSWEALCAGAREAWRSECRQIRTDFAAACLNGTAFGDYDALQIH
jgi:hypothetical protein